MAKNRRQTGRPPGSRSRPIHERNADMLDRWFTKILRQGGVEVRDGNGQLVLDANGEQVYSMSAAILNVIRARLKDVGLAKQGLRTPQRTLVEEAMARGLSYDAEPLHKIGGAG